MSIEALEARVREARRRRSATHPDHGGPGGPAFHAANAAFVEAKARLDHAKQYGTAEASRAAWEQQRAYEQSVHEQATNAARKAREARMRAAAEQGRRAEGAGIPSTESAVCSDGAWPFLSMLPTMRRKSRKPQERTSNQNRNLTTLARKFIILIVR